MPADSSWVVPFLTALSGATAGSVTTALLRGRERRRSRIRKRYRSLERRLRAFEASDAVFKAEIASIRAELEGLRADIDEPNKEGD